LREETGLEAELWLCGTVVVDTGTSPGIGLYVFTGDFTGGELKESQEGSLEWISVDQVEALPVVEDIPTLLRRVSAMERSVPPFHAISKYVGDKLVVSFSN
jgi:8-oxo-dGTP pyrophosphatase MutT (NUDIX family)